MRRLPVWSASIIIPGLAQAAQMRLMATALWAVLVGGLYCLCVPIAIFMHLLCVIDAATWSPPRLWTLRQIYRAIHFARDEEAAARRLDIIRKGLDS